MSIEAILLPFSPHPPYWKKFHSFLCTVFAEVLRVGLGDGFFLLTLSLEMSVEFLLTC